MLPQLEILYEDNHCIAVHKPAGVPSAHFQGTEETVDRAVKLYLKHRYQKPGNVFLGVVHRLDKPVSGVLLFARTSKSAARLAEQFRLRTVQKVYWAVIEGSLTHPEGKLVDWLLHDCAAKRVIAVPPHTSEAQEAVLDYASRITKGKFTWLELRPQTGRKHQLRVQLATRGFPIYGDTKYGSPHRFDPAIALHARALTFLHPIRRTPITLTTAVPHQWQQVLTSVSDFR